MAAAGLRIKADSNLQRDLSSTGTTDMMGKNQEALLQEEVDLPNKELDQDLVEEDP